MPGSVEADPRIGGGGRAAVTREAALAWPATALKSKSGGRPARVGCSDGADVLSVDGSMRSTGGVTRVSQIRCNLDQPSPRYSGSASRMSANGWMRRLPSRAMSSK